MTATHTLPGSVREATLYVAFELGAKTWKLGLTSGFGVEPWVTSVAAGDWARVREVLAKAKRRFGLPAAAVVVSCYEAGRDGFWIHRALTREGIRNRVVDSASIEVNRRQRRAKTDRLDARKLVAMLVRAWLGERDVWREVRVPTEADEAARHGAQQGRIDAPFYQPVVTGGVEPEQGEEDGGDGQRAAVDRDGGNSMLFFPDVLGEQGCWEGDKRDAYQEQDVQEEQDVVGA